MILKGWFLILLLIGFSYPLGAMLVDEVRNLALMMKVIEEHENALRDAKKKSLKSQGIVYCMNGTKIIAKCDGEKGEARIWINDHQLETVPYERLKIIFKGLKRKPREKPKIKKKHCGMQ